MVTAELAAAIPVLLLVLVLGLAAVGAATEHLACGQALRVAARHLARGESGAQVQAAAAPVLPRGATLEVTSAGAEGVVTVRQPARAGALGLVHPGCALSATVDVESTSVSLGSVSLGSSSRRGASDGAT